MKTVAPAAPPPSFTVHRVALDGAVYASDPRTESAARAWAAVLLRDDPSAAISIAPVALVEPPPSGYRVTREGPGAESKDYGVHQRRGTADKIAHNVSRAHPTALVVVEPIRCAS